LAGCKVVGVVLLAARIKGAVHPLSRVSSHVIRFVAIIEAAFISSGPVRVVQSRARRRSRSLSTVHALTHLPTIVLGAAGRKSVVQPHGGILGHVRWSGTVVLASVITQPVGIILVATGRRARPHAFHQVPRIMFLAAITLGAEEVLNIVLSHVEWFIPIADTPSVLAFPIGIPQGTGTSVVELAHATIVVP